MDPGKIVDCIAAELQQYSASSSSSGGSRQGIQFLVLLLSGALCPPHRGHTAILHAAATAVRDDPARPEGVSVVVVGLVLAPSSNAYVQGKLGSDALSLEERVALCELAARNDPLMSVLRAGEASGSRAAALVQATVAAAWRDARGRHAAHPGIDIDSERAFRCVPLYGSDFLLRQPRCLFTPTIIAARADADDTAAAARELVLAKTTAPPHPSFRFIELTASHGQMHRDGSSGAAAAAAATVATPVISVQAAAVPDVSSTAVRRALQDAAQLAGNPTAAAAAAREFLQRALHPAVLARLLRAHAVHCESSSTGISAC